jgi:hypothetical protein
MHSVHSLRVYSASGEPSNAASRNCSGRLYQTFVTSDGRNGLPSTSKTGSAIRYRTRLKPTIESVSKRTTAIRALVSRSTRKDAVASSEFVTMNSIWKEPITFSVAIFIGCFGGNQSNGLGYQCSARRYCCEQRVASTLWVMVRLLSHDFGYGSRGRENTGCAHHSSAPIGIGVGLLCFDICGRFSAASLIGRFRRTERFLIAQQKGSH